MFFLECNFFAFWSFVLNFYTHILGAIEQCPRDDSMIHRLMTVMITAIVYDGTQRWDEFCSMNWNGKDKTCCTRLPYQPIKIIITWIIISHTTQTQHTQLLFTLHLQITKTFYHLIGFIQSMEEEKRHILGFKTKHIQMKKLMPEYR